LKGVLSLFLVRAGLLAALVVGISGCVQTPVPSERPAAARLMISRGVNGVNMQWKGEVGSTYTLYYKDPMGADMSWRPVPGYQGIRGTGELIEVRDSSAAAKHRQYRVHTDSMKL
jgi:hypothetical protein